MQHSYAFLAEFPFFLNLMPWLLLHSGLNLVLLFQKIEYSTSYQARYIPFFNVRQYTQINVHFIKAYGIVPIAYGCTEVYDLKKLCFMETSKINQTHSHLDLSGSK